jgi:hypothetical protein
MEKAVEFPGPALDNTVQDFWQAYGCHFSQGDREALP